MPATLGQYLKIIQNPSSHGELQKAANQGRRCTWEKLSAIKANCAIELSLDECVSILNQMRMLKRRAEKAAAVAAAASPHSIPPSRRFSASKRIPSWNRLARESSIGSVEEDLISEVVALHQGAIGLPGTSTDRNHRGGRSTHDGSDSESEETTVGVGTVGSSEAIILVGLAFKKKWQQR